MDRQDQHKLLSRIAALGQISKSDARALLDEIADGRLKTRIEAEFIVKINRQLDTTFPDWDACFSLLLKDFLLTADAPIGWMDEQECVWLISQLKPFASTSKLNEIDLLLDVLPHAEGAPRAMAKCAFDAIVSQARHIGRMSEPLLERTRALLIAPMGETSAWITQWEARRLLQINADIGNARNAPDWATLYARALANHLVMRSHPSPETMAEALDRRKWLTAQTEEELGGAYLTSIQQPERTEWYARCASSPDAAQAGQQLASQSALKSARLERDKNWLEIRLGWNHTINRADRVLIDLLRTEMPGFVQGLTVALRPNYSLSASAFS